MVRITFTKNLQRYVDCPAQLVRASTVYEALHTVFDANRLLAEYILDEQGRLRKHIAVFVDGRLVNDRIRLSDAVSDDSEIYVMQALSGG